LLYIVLFLYNLKLFVTALKFYQLNQTGIQVDLSTFSKANKTKDPQGYF